MDNLLLLLAWMAPPRDGELTPKVLDGYPVRVEIIGPVAR